MSFPSSCFVQNAHPGFAPSIAAPLARPRSNAASPLSHSSFLAAAARSVPRNARRWRARRGGSSLPITCTTNIDPHGSPLRGPSVQWPAMPTLAPAAFGRLLLALVPIIWASYSIVIKYMYSMSWTFGPATFNVLRLVLSVVPLMPSMLRYLRDRVRQNRANKSAVLTATVTGGFELGMWTCAVNTLQLIGLRHTGASRGAFLTQLCTVIVPVASYATGAEKRLSRNVMVASLMSVVGVGLLTLDNAMSPFTWIGDGSLLLSAFVSAAYVMRSKTFAERGDGGPMVAFKVFAQMLFAFVYLCVVNAKTVVSWSATRAAVMNAFVGMTAGTLGMTVGLMLFTGLVLSVGSTVLQMRGQKMVSASEAVIIFTSTPLWTALMAIPLGERFGTRGIAGAFLIFVATMLCSSPEKKRGKMVGA